MQSFSLVMLVVVLNAIVAMQPSNAEAMPDFQASRRDLNKNQYKRVLQNMVARNVVEPQKRYKNSYKQVREHMETRTLPVAVWNKLNGKGGLNVAPCPIIKSVESQTVAQCQYLCEITSGCDAIDINANGHCTFRTCDQQTPPLDSDTSYDSYIIHHISTHWNNFPGKGGLNVAACAYMKSVEGKSVEQCKTLCELTSGCDAIDINQGGHCTFRKCDEQTPPLDSNTAYNSYIMQQTPAVWNQLQGKGGLNVDACAFIKSVESQTVAQCQYLCGITSGCDAIDINQGGHCTFRKCDQQNPPLDSNTAYNSYVMQQTPAIWKPFPGKGGLNVAPCAFMKSVEGKSVAQCKTLCELTSGCDAIDINQGGHCTFRQCDEQTPPVDSDKSYDSYIIHRSPVWNSFQGKGGLNVGACPFMRSVEGKSVAQCQYECESTDHCDAIDINANGHCTFRSCTVQAPSLDSNTSYDSYIMQGLGAKK